MSDPFVLWPFPSQAKDEAGKAFNDYWKPSLSVLADKEFITKLKSYDKDNIPPK